MDGKSSFKSVLKDGIHGVCFDVDSTVSQTEGIDQLAKFLNVGAEVEKITHEAMNGNLDFREALQQRLKVMQIKEKDIQSFLSYEGLSLSPGIRTLMMVLQEQNIPIFLISGGFRELILPIAQELGIHQDHIFSNSFVFKENCPYATFDTAEPTSRSGGKKVAVHKILEILTNSSNEIPRIVMIGDGMTDAEAKPPAHFFIGYGGVAIRPKVQQQADWFVTSFDEITQVFSEGNKDLLD